MAVGTKATALPTLVRSLSVSLQPDPRARLQRLVGDPTTILLLGRRGRTALTLRLFRREFLPPCVLFQLRLCLPALPR